MATWFSNLVKYLKQEGSQNTGHQDATSAPLQPAEVDGLSLRARPGLSNPWQSALNPRDPTQDVILIPDLRQSSSNTWTTDDKQFWPERLPADVRIFTFHYNSGFADSIATILSYDAIRMIALNLLSEIQKMQRHGKRLISPVLIAHGYGGLICEQAYLFSRQAAPAWDGLFQIDRLVLFGTPHFRAGLAQWALISAKKLGITPCPDRPQQQDWSQSPIREHLDCIATMQKEFRDLNSGPKMACYFSLLRVPVSKLELSPEWAIVPGVISIAISADHFSMTKLNKTKDQERLFQLLRGNLPCRISQETLKQRWIECSQKYHGQQSSHVGTMEQIPTRDKIFSPKPNAEQEIRESRRSTPPDIQFSSTYSLLGYHDSGLDRLPFIVPQIHEKAILNDLMKVDSLLRKADFPTERILKAALESTKGTETLKALFVLRGNEINIKEEHIKIAVNDTATGVDIMELFLLLRGDQIDHGSLAKTAAGNTENGPAFMQLILDRYGQQNLLGGMDGIVKIAVANTGSGFGVMQVLLDRYGNQIDLSDEVAKDAASNKSLDMRLKVSFLLIRTVIDRGGDCKKLTRLLLETNNRIPDSTERFSWEMLLHAAIRDDIETCKLLLETGQVDSDLEAIERDFTWTPLLWAICTQKEDVVKALVDTGKVNTNNVGDKTRAGQTALSWAAEWGLVQAVEQLLRVDGIDVNMTDNNGRTPLSSAIGEGKDEVVELLLKTGKVNVHAKDKYDQTPLSRARARGDENIMQLLRNAGELDTDSG